MKVHGKRVPRKIAQLDKKAKDHDQLASQAHARGDKVTARREWKTADMYRKDFSFQLAAFLKE